MVEELLLVAKKWVMALSSPHRRVAIGDTGRVIHYEPSKTIQNQKLERTGALNATPHGIERGRSARHERKKHRIVKQWDDRVESETTKNSLSGV